MSIWQKRFIVVFNIAVLLVFLDVTLLIFVRSVNSSGIYQTMDVKLMTFAIWLLCYAVVWMCQGLGYVAYQYFFIEKKKTRKRYV